MMHYTRPGFANRSELRKMLRAGEVRVYARSGYARKGKHNDPVAGTACIAGYDNKPINIELRGGTIHRIVGTS